MNNMSLPNFKKIGEHDKSLGKSVRRQGEKRIDRQIHKISQHMKKSPAHKALESAKEKGSGIMRDLHKMAKKEHEGDEIHKNFGSFEDRMKKGFYKKK